jgi:hypothetical protein
MQGPLDAILARSVVAADLTPKTRSDWQSIGQVSIMAIVDNVHISDLGSTPRCPVHVLCTCA